MLAFCVQPDIPLRMTGKVIIASESTELSALEELKGRADAIGVKDAKVISREQLWELEPFCQGVGALHVPSAAITDFSIVAAKCAEILIGIGGEIRTGAPVIHLVRSGGQSVIETTVGAFQTNWVINCAGLHSDSIGRQDAAAVGIRIIPFRGEYYWLRREREHLARGLVYPVPKPELALCSFHACCSWSCARGAECGHQTDTVNQTTVGKAAKPERLPAFPARNVLVNAAPGYADA